MSITQVPASPEVIAAWQSHFTETQPERMDDGLTAKELAAMADVSLRSMQQQIERGVQDGRFIAGISHRQDTAGRRMQVPVYKIVEQAKPKGRKRAGRN